ncbi:unnamed protein product, partial [marine sediment metagenome]
ALGKHPMALIQIAKKDNVRGFGIIMNSGQAGVYPNNTYSVGEEHLELLKKAGIRYKEIE